MYFHSARIKYAETCGCNRLTHQKKGLTNFVLKRQSHEKVGELKAHN
jgi:hypothetical protein